MPVNSPLKRSMALTMADHRTKVAIKEMNIYGWNPLRKLALRGEANVSALMEAPCSLS